MEKVIVAAVSENGVIGKDGDIPWHFPEDMEHFRRETVSHPVIMGRGTYESLPDEYRPLPGRTNIVLTRSDGFSPNESVKIANSLDEAWDLARKEDEKAFIAGGASVYEQVLPEADRMVITRVHEEYDGDTYFPEPDWSNWDEVSRDDREDLSFVVYERST